ncbi:MAG: RimK/LysX family protein [Candidatus Jordarchaeum sp.]|uniref:RimK/LysX family protein n=1 Tax=Candidatus Jordarchaeum sp. TaxID=2823881 RepID=UPI0040498BED
MGLEEFKKILKFTASEEKLSKLFDINSDLLIPLLLSIKYGGDWSLRNSESVSVAVKDRETIYDREIKEGTSFETIYLLINPRIITRQGKVYRIEKCGLSDERELVERSYNIKVSIDKALVAVIDPKEKVIKLKKLDKQELGFEGSLAFSLEHELEHVTSKEKLSTGKPIWNFNYVYDQDLKNF